MRRYRYLATFLCVVGLVVAVSRDGEAQAYSPSANGGTPGGAAGGNLAGTYPNPTVAQINGSSVPAGGALTTGNVLQVTGLGTLSYSPVNVGGGSAYITGVIPAGNQASQTMGGDTSGTTASSTVVGLRGVSLPSPSGSSNYLTYNGSVLAWTGIPTLPSVTGSGLWHTTAGTLDAASVHGTAGQLMIGNSGGTDAVFTTCSGDLTCSTSTAGQFNIGTIAGLAGGTVILGDAVHNLSLTQPTSTQATPPTFALRGSQGYSAAASVGGAAGAWTIGPSPGGAGQGGNNAGGAGALGLLQGSNGGASVGSAANTNGGGWTFTTGLAGTGGGGAAGLPGAFALNVGATAIGSLGLSANDFVAMGAIPATTGFIRLPTSSTTAIVRRNSANSGDETVLFTVGNSNGSDATLTGSQYASIGTTTPGTNGSLYFLSYALQGWNTVGGRTVFGNSGYSSMTPSSLAGTGGTGTVTVVGSSSTDVGTGALIFGSALTSATVNINPLASTSGGSGAAGIALTVAAQTGQAATGASNNGGAGGTVSIGGSPGGTSGSATAGIGGVLSVTSGEANQTITATNTYTVDTNTTTSDLVVFANKAGAFTITLPTPTNGRIVYIQDKSGAANTNNVTIAHHSAENVNGASSILINTAYGGYQCRSDGTNWFCR